MDGIAVKERRQTLDPLTPSVEVRFRDRPWAAVGTAFFLVGKQQGQVFPVGDGEGLIENNFPVKVRTG
jgi:hypothetical protein